MRSETSPAIADLDSELVAELRRLLATETGRAVSAIGDEEVREAYGRALATDQDDLAEPSLERMFESRARQQAGEVAVLFRGEPVAYAELDRRANRLARFLRRRGVGPETLVGIALPPSTDRAMALLGVLKAGGAFVPIAPGRRGTALRAAARPLLTLTAEPLDGNGVIVLPQVRETIERESEESLADVAGPENLVAVVEDGAGHLVLVERRHLLNRLEGLEAEIELDSSDVLLHSGGEDADWEILWALLYGGRLAIAEASPAALDELGVTILRLTPTRLSALLAKGRAPLGALRAVLCGGEALRADLAVRFAERSAARLVHFYAAAEAAAEVSFHASSGRANRDPLPVGDTFNLSVFLLDPYLKPVPQGLPGEIHLAAPELPRGFLGDPCATALAFLPNPLAGEPGSRMLRTGDLGRLLPEGALALAGAAGRQVWIGGRRLDLGAVEVELLLEPSIVEAAVLVREEAAAIQIVAYLVVAGAWAPERYAERLRWRWPEELLPAAWIPLSRLPLTPTGRLDEAALLRLPVIDGELIAHWEESLCALPEIREAAVVVRETADTLPPLHFDDLLPGWKSIAAGSADTAGAAPAGETTAGGAATAPEAPGVPAIAHGPALALPTGAPVTLPEALERAALEHPENGITYLRSDGSAACQ
ncbi:MAG TPA: AMP-binding protein, partial [Thermoanaerobaculia bacterium]|nr:AMP-binding protein [Thermoanaerobaculia bacterium]